MDGFPVYGLKDNFKWVIRGNKGYNLGINKRRWFSFNFMFFNTLYRLGKLQLIITVNNKILIRLLEKINKIRKNFITLQ